MAGPLGFQPVLVTQDIEDEKRPDLIEPTGNNFRRNTIFTISFP